MAKTNASRAYLKQAFCFLGREKKKRIRKDIFRQEIFNLENYIFFGNTDKNDYYTHIKQSFVFLVGDFKLKNNAIFGGKFTPLRIKTNHSSTHVKHVFVFSSKKKGKKGQKQRKINKQVQRYFCLQIHTLEKYVFAGRKVCICQPVFPVYDSIPAWWSVNTLALLIHKAILAFPATRKVIGDAHTENNILSYTFLRGLV